LRGVHLPVWFGVADLPKAMPFAYLYAAQGMSRTILMTIIPLRALELLGDAQKVSMLYLTVSVLGLACSLAMPLLVHLIRRRRVVAVGVAGMIVAAVLLQADQLIVYAIGMLFYVVGSIAIDVCLNLYLMDNIPRKEFARFEPVRIWFMGVAFIVGPYLGIWLWANVDPLLPSLLTIFFALVLLTLFLYLRLSDNPAIQAAKAPPPNPIKFFPRFFRQPRLRLAWLLAVGRSAWWAMFFVYAPIYCVEAGLGDDIAGMMASIGSAAVLLVPVWAKLGRKYGIRALLVVGYFASAVSSLVVAAVAGSPWLGVALLVVASFATSLIDGAGNMLFLRAVHPYERPEMTSVFATFRDTSQIGPPALFSVLLKIFALPAVFAAGGLGMLVMARYARFIPKRY
jgi:MFS family permease